MSTKTDKIDRLAELTAAKRTDQGHGESLWREAFKRLRRSPMAIAGTIVVGIFIVIAIVGPYIAPFDPVSQTWGDEVFPNKNTFVGPRAENWLGLDHLGRDQFSRMVIGARQSLMVGVVATLLGFAFGALLGGIAGAARHRT